MDWVDEEGEVRDFDTAQVCLDGHTITDVYHRAPQFNQDFCDKCGRPTITACPSCQAEIRGLHRDTSYATGGHGTPAPPHFCYGCGKPYPWTESKLRAARDLADLSESLSDEEKAALKGSLDDIVSDTPRTTVAATRVKALLLKAGSAIGEGIRSILVDVASETAKKTLGL